jgi:hypothetical protein
LLWFYFWSCSYTLSMLAFLSMLSLLLVRSFLVAILWHSSLDHSVPYRWSRTVVAKLNSSSSVLGIFNGMVLARTCWWLIESRKVKIVANAESRNLLNLKWKVKYIDVIFVENTPSWQLISEQCWELMFGASWTYRFSNQNHIGNFKRCPNDPEFSTLFIRTNSYRGLMPFSIFAKKRKKPIH